MKQINNNPNTPLETLKQDETYQQQTKYSTIETLKQDETDQQQTKYSTRNTETR